MDTMDNQQETEKAWIAGIIDGEGCLAIYRSQKRTKADISISNTNHQILQRFIAFLKKYDLHYYVRTYKKIRGRKYLYHIQVTKVKDKLKFLELIGLYISKQEFKIVKKFLERRAEFPNNSGREKDEFGRFTKGFDKECEKIYEEYKAFKDSSETLCQSPIELG